MKRVSKLVKHEISEVIQQLNLTDCGLVTVTDTVISPDLQDGRVYVSVIGSSEEQQRAIALLTERHGHIQRELARRVILKYTPRLQFFLDETEVRAQYIEHLIEEHKPANHD